MSAATVALLGGFIAGGVLLILIAVVDSDDEAASEWCADESAIEGDVDGDGVDDRVVHVMTDGGPVLVACTSATGDQQIEGLGGADQLELIDSQADGRMEILYGSQHGDLRDLRVAVVDDGLLQPVMFQNTLDGGDPSVLVPFEIQDGYGAGLPPDGPRSAFGCEVWSTGERYLITYDLALEDGRVDGSNMSSYVIDGATARVAHDAHDYFHVDSAPLMSDPPDDLPPGGLERLELYRSLVLDDC
jgi:hypothetical protein